MINFFKYSISNNKLRNYKNIKKIVLLYICYIKYTKIMYNQTFYFNIKNRNYNN